MKLICFLLALALLISGTEAAQTKVSLGDLNLTQPMPSDASMGGHNLTDRGNIDRGEYYYKILKTDTQVLVFDSSGLMKYQGTMGTLPTPADDDTALQYCIDHLPGGAGLTYFMQPRRIVTTSNLYFDDQVFINKAFVVIDGSDGTWWSKPGSDIPILKIGWQGSMMRGVKLKDLHIYNPDNNGSINTAYMVHAKDCVNMVWENVYLRNDEGYCRTAAIESTIAGGSDWLTLINFESDGAIYINNVDNLFISVAKFLAYNCPNDDPALDMRNLKCAKVSQAYTSGSATNASSEGAYFYNITSCTFSACEFDSSQVMLHTSKLNTFTGCVWWNQLSHGLYLYNAQANSIIGGTFKDGNRGDNSASDIILVGADSKQNTITGTTHYISTARANKGYWITEYSGPNYNDYNHPNGDVTQYTGKVYTVGANSIKDPTTL